MRPLKSRVLLTFSLILLAAMMLSGCAASPEDKAKKAVEAYLDAYAEGDGAKACEQLSVEGEQALDRLNAAETGSAPASCEAGVEAVSKLEQADIRKQIEKAKVNGVCFQSDDRAIVTIENAPLSPTVVRVDDEWKINDFGNGIQTKLHCQEPPK